VGSETIFAFGLDHLGVPKKQELERASDGAGMNRLPKPVEDEDWMVKMPYHTFSQQLPRKLAGTPRAASKR
jgi:hypothetical protein